VTFPPLPSGQTWAPDTPRSWLPATDGTVFVASGVGVAYLRFGGWTIIGGFFGTIAAVSLGANGHPQRVWLVDDGNDYLAGIYWHALP
jgi:hypothetical protein